MSNSERISIPLLATMAADYGWPLRLVEMAAANAIRLEYLDRDMLAEADVNLTLGTLAVRRRNGGGPHGQWVDIDSPLLPTRRDIIHTMDLLQFGDGAPGRVVEATVQEHSPQGVIYRLGESRRILVPTDLLSVQDTFKRPDVGTKQILVMLAGTDTSTGCRMATRRGKEFVASVMEEFHPQCVSGIWTGASNSWAVIRMKPAHVSTWLEKGGINMKAMQQLLGLKRITLVPEGDGATPLERADNEIRHFVNNAWKACIVRHLTPEKVVIYTPLDDQDPKKIRTFTSMLSKIVSNRTIEVK